MKNLNVHKKIDITGYNAFRVLWLGQALSVLGTGMTRFAVMIWAYQIDGAATTLALLGFFSSLTYIIASPFAGVFVDRFDRRKIMVLADLSSGLLTILLLCLFLFDGLEIWHLYLSVGLVGGFQAFQEPAFSASVSLLVPRDKYTRCNALLGLGRSVAHMSSPVLAGLLLQFFGLELVMALDLLTMVLGMTGLFLVRIPAPQASSEGRQVSEDFVRQMRFGVEYIFRRPGLRGLLFTFFLVNLFGTVTYFAVLSPMILSRSGGDDVILGLVRTTMGLGGIAGGVIISLWGGPKRKVRAYLFSTLSSFLVCDFLMAISHTGTAWALTGFLAELTIPFIVSPYYALWQELVPADVQGRVFATREMIQVSSQPVGYLAGGLLADNLFEPALQSGGILAGPLGGLVGTGPGAGMAAMFLFTSLLGGLTGLFGLLSPAIRKLDMVQEIVPVEDSHLAIPNQYME